MPRALVSICCAALFPVLGCCQTETTSARPASFEIADVHPSPPTRNPFMRAPIVRNGRYEIRKATMLDLIRTAWSIDAERVMGGPNWLEEDAFDVIAKIPEGTTRETAKPMLQALLEERFQLAVHNDTRPVAAYALKVNKRALLKPAAAAELTGGGCRFVAPPAPKPTGPNGPPPAPPLFSIACANITMAAFAEALHSGIAFAPQYLNGRVVVDETELKGAWDFELKLSPPGMIGPLGLMQGTTLSEALDKLGLRLDPVDAPLPVIVVDRVNRKPTPNPPKVEEALHETPPPAEFEVADIKLSDPNTRTISMNVRPGGRVEVQGFTLRMLIQQAWDVNNQTLAGTQPWMDTDRYDIVAKADADGPQIDIDTVWGLMRALLQERFQMKVHTEDRAGTAYTLVAVKPKMKASDPGTRTRCKQAPAAGGKDTNPALSRSIACQGVTMAEFAQKLKTLAPDYIQTSVQDATGLEGTYDFTINYSPAFFAQMQGGRGGLEPGQLAPPAIAGPAAEVSDPNGGLTLMEAMEKQLGLKLEAQKRPIPVLVIDHVERKPAEN
ncbi:MAG TPA: TIGR03435 family protein [Bryobacteraceae bacterium]|nr:TIGR03435 family protein [Bryobacteraceae bacterium]